MVVFSAPGWDPPPLLPKPNLRGRCWLQTSNMLHKYMTEACDDLLTYVCPELFLLIILINAYFMSLQMLHASPNQRQPHELMA